MSNGLQAAARDEWKRWAEPATRIRAVGVPLAGGPVRDLDPVVRPAAGHVAVRQAEIP